MTARRPHALLPHLFVKDVPAAITFYRKAFGVTGLFRIVLPDGTILFSCVIGLAIVLRIGC